MQKITYVSAFDDIKVTSQTSNSVPNEENVENVSNPEFDESESLTSQRFVQFFKNMTILHSLHNYFNDACFIIFNRATQFSTLTFLHLQFRILRCSFILTPDRLDLFVFAHMAMDISISACLFILLFFVNENHFNKLLIVHH